MKRLTIIISAILLVLCLVQCRKELPIANPETSGKPYSITLNMNEVSKVDVTTASGDDFGKVDFKNGDKLYVANQGKFVGTLTHDGTNFEGTIYDPGTTISGYLYFYFLGNNAPTEDVTHPSTTHPSKLTVDISDQSKVTDGSTTKGMPVISCGKSDQPFTGGGSYTGKLANKCALAKFHVSSISSENIVIAGLKDQVQFDLSNTDVYSTSNPNVTFGYKNGTINVGTRRGDIWLILLPQPADAGNDAYTENVTYTGTRGALTKEVIINKVISESITVIVNEKQQTPEEGIYGALNGIFSVSNTQKVFFSQGNLQYIGNDGTWKFANKQYVFLGTTTNQNSTSTTATRDLFGWGTSGWNNGNYFYQPYCTSKSDNEPYTTATGYGYGPYDPSKPEGERYKVNLTGGFANADWGIYNAIKSGDNTNPVSTWRTLSSGEWSWLLESRTASRVNGIANARFTLATINTDGTSVKGMIIFPDIYAAGTPSGVTWGTINGKSDFTTQCTAAGWDALHAAGCVFLPAAGRRLGGSKTSVGLNSGGSGTETGLYWSSNQNSSQTAYRLRFSNGVFEIAGAGAHRYFGYAVRLVTDINTVVE